MDIVNQLRGTPPDEVFEALHDVMHLYRLQRHRALAAVREPVSELEARTLGFFGRHPGATLSELASHSRRDKSQLARLIAGLRERGLLEARPDASDRRSVRLYLTRRAEAMHRAAHRELRRVVRLATADLSVDECALLARLLGRVRDRLQGSLEP